MASHGSVNSGRIHGDISRRRRLLIIERCLTASNLSKLAVFLARFWYITFVKPRRHSTTGIGYSPLARTPAQSLSVALRCCLEGVSRSKTRRSPGIIAISHPLEEYLSLRAFLQRKSQHLQPNRPLDRAEGPAPSRSDAC
jgi:hypothetical protein